jgi:hypothetical protein
MSSRSSRASISASVSSRSSGIPRASRRSSAGGTSARLFDFDFDLDLDFFDDRRGGEGEREDDDEAEVEGDRRAFLERRDDRSREGDRDLERERLSRSPSRPARRPTGLADRPREALRPRSSAATGFLAS